MIDYLKSPFFSPFCGPSVGQGQLSSLIISPSSLSLHTETLYLTSPVKFHTGLHLLSLICWGCLPCPARLWRPRFSAGRGTYSPYRHSAPHPPWRIRLSAPGGSQTAWIMPFLPCGCPLDGFCYSRYIHFNSPLTVLPENRRCLSDIVRVWLIGDMRP